MYIMYVKEPAQWNDLINGCHVKFISKHSNALEPLIVFRIAITRHHINFCINSRQHHINIPPDPQHHIHLVKHDLYSLS